MTPTAWEIFLWIIIPYLALASFILGHIWRYRYDKFGWTTRSSQIYESKMLRIGSPLFHYGIIFVFLGVIGLGIPRAGPKRSALPKTCIIMAITIGLGAGVASSAGWSSSSIDDAPTRSLVKPPKWTSSCI